jgi:hypothetical protein
MEELFIIPPKNLSNQAFDLNHLQNGIYILNISNSSFNSSQK